MRLRFAAQALDDLDSISSYIRENDPYAADRVEGDRQLATTPPTVPRSGGRQQTAEVRKPVTPRYPYLVYYPIDAGSG